MREKECTASDVKTMLALILVIIMMTLACQSSSVYAVTVPKVSVNEDCVIVKDKAPARVAGSVSKARGQVITLFKEDGETVLFEQMMADTDQQSAFQLTVPDDVIKRPGKTLLYVKSQPAKGVAASKMIRVTIKAMKSQKISGTSKVTLTNLKTSAKIKAKASSGKALTYTSSKPKVVSVSKSGKLTRHKNGTVTITVRQKGNDTYLPAEKTVRVKSRKSTCTEQINGAVAWAVKIANDNSFAYGTGSGAHRYGCYFCGTNYGPRKYTKPSKRYRKTYCCNPFVHAAYAHGAMNPKMLAACRSGSGIGMSKDTFYRYGCWKCVGKPSYQNLKKGDVLVKSTHVAMYIGKGKLVEAGSSNWSAGSIAVKKMSSSRYHGFAFVMRYTGY